MYICIHHQLFREESCFDANSNGVFFRQCLLYILCVEDSAKSFCGSGRERESLLQIWMCLKRVCVWSQMPISDFFLTPECHFFLFFLGGGGRMVWALHLFIINILFERAIFLSFFWNDPFQAKASSIKSGCKKRIISVLKTELSVLMLYWVQPERWK